MSKHMHQQMEIGRLSSILIVERRYNAFRAIIDCLPMPIQSLLGCCCRRLKDETGNKISVSRWIKKMTRGGEPGHTLGTRLIMDENSSLKQYLDTLHFQTNLEQEGLHIDKDGKERRDNDYLWDQVRDHMRKFFEQKQPNLLTRQ